MVKDDDNLVKKWLISEQCSPLEQISRERAREERKKMVDVMEYTCS